MKAVGIIGLSSELDKVMRYCGESEIFHPDDAMNFYENTGKFVPINERNPYQDPLAELISSVQSAGLALEFRKTKKFTVSDSGIKKYVKFVSSKLDRFTTETLKINAELDECRKNQEELNHFIGSNLDMEKLFACKLWSNSKGKL
jgi:V/A-type H+-transporting ATPase subunit I